MFTLLQEVQGESLTKLFEGLGTGVGTGIPLLAAIWWMIQRQDKRADKQENRSDKQFETLVKMEQNLSQFGVSQAKMQETQVKTIELIQDLQKTNMQVFGMMADKISGKIEP